MLLARRLIPVLLLLTGGLLAGCGTRYADLPTFSADHQLLQLVVEMPAGSNHERRYNPTTNSFEPRRLAGLEAVVEFLPAPGNLGFIPGTSGAAVPGGPTSPLSALLLAESQPAGTVVEVLPVALLTLDVNGQLQPVVVAVPARPGQRILPRAITWASLNQHYPNVQAFLSLWFRHRAPNTRIVGWKDEQAASQEVRRWMQ